MVTISRITTQKRNQGRYNVYIHNGRQETYGFSVDEDVLVQFNLRKGLEINKEQIKQLIDQDLMNQSYNQALKYLSYRMRSEKEVRSFLATKEVSSDQIDQMIHKLKSQNLLDDLEFANMFVRSRIQSSRKGPLLIKNELKNKGVTEIISNQALKEYTYDIQFKKAMNIVKKRLERSSKHSFKRQLDQAKAALQRNGYTHDVILDVVRQFQENKDENAEWLAIQHQGEKLFRKHGKKYKDYELQQKVKEGLYRQGFSIDIIHKYLTNQVI